MLPSGARLSLSASRIHEEDIMDGVAQQSEKDQMPAPLITPADLVWEKLDWFEGYDAADDGGLGCNRDYRDFRGRSSADARRVLEDERRLVAEARSNEVCWISEDGDGPEIEGLDLGVASAVVALSVIGCIPFNSCNGGALGGDHDASVPVVGFYARPEQLQTIYDVSASRDVTLCAERGALWLSSSSPEAMLSWAASLLEHLSGEGPPYGPGSASGQHADCPDHVI